MGIVTGPCNADVVPFGGDVGAGRCRIDWASGDDTSQVWLDGATFGATCGVDASVGQKPWESSQVQSEGRRVQFGRTLFGAYAQDG